MIPYFFSCDWGTTSFRLRRVDAADGHILDERREAVGVKVLSSKCAAGDALAREAAFACFLRERLMSMMGHETKALDGVSVVVSGMASSSVGWRELPYAILPFGLDGSNLRHETFPLDLNGRVSALVHLISGARSESEIMRGEETELLGLFDLARHARIAEDGMVVLPGTHSKHIRVHDRRVCDIHTFMSGELFEVLAAHSLLRPSVQVDGDATSSSLTEASSAGAFVTGVQTADAAGLARGLFQTRTRTVLHGVPPSVNRWFLSGLIIGSELVGFRDSKEEFPILLAAPEALSPPYRLAFETLGLAARLAVAPPEEMALSSVRGHLQFVRRLPKPGL